MRTNKQPMARISEQQSVFFIQNSHVAFSVLSKLSGISTYCIKRHLERNVAGWTNSTYKGLGNPEEVK